MNADSLVWWQDDLAQLTGQLPVHRRFRRSSAAETPFFLTGVVPWKRSTSTSRRNFALAWATSLGQAGTAQSGPSEWSRYSRRDVLAPVHNDPGRLSPAPAAVRRAALAYGLGPRRRLCGAARQARQTRFQRR